MNSPTLKTRNFFTTNNHNQLPCESSLKFYSSLRLLPLLRLLQNVISCRIQIRYVHLVIRGGLNALAKITVAKLLGYVMLGVGALTIFAHQIFFDESVRDYNWIYLNWYYYFFTNRLFLVLIFWSVGFFVFVPANSSLAIIPASLFQSAGWIGLVHNSFFVQTNEQFLEWPHWSVWVMGASFAIGILLTVKYHLYWWNHKCRGNHARFAGLAEMNIPIEQKEAMFKSLAKEYRKINKAI